MSTTLASAPTPADPQDLVRVLMSANRMLRAGRLADAVPHLESCQRQMQQLGDAPTALRKHVERELGRCSELLVSAERQADPLAPGRQIRVIDFGRGKAPPSLPKVSIVIPHFDSGGLVYEALDSVAAQRMRDIETLVIDDASPAGALDLLRLGRYPSWMRLRVLRLEHNSGPSHCRNLGIVSSRGRAICLLDADDCLDTDALESRWQILNAQPALAAAFVPMTLVDEQGSSLGATILDNAQAFTFPDFSSNKFPCSALMFRRRAILLDLFDESLKHGEDYECFSRIAQRGGIYARAGAGRVLFRQHGASLTHRDTMHDLNERVAVTRRVHERNLDWTLTGTGNPLGEFNIARESALRAFPVACIYALRGRMKDANAIAMNIDADIVAAVPGASAAGTIRYFLVREEQIPADGVNAFLAQDAACDTLMQWLGSVFSTRHRAFVTELLTSLLGRVPESAPTLMPRVFNAPIAVCTWERFLDDPKERRQGYVLLHRPGERMPEEALAQTRSYLAQRGDLEALLAYRVAFSGDQVLTDLHSIGAADPDGPLAAQLGRDVWPAVVLHELAASALLQWMRGRLPATGSAAPGPREIETLALQGIHALRLKAVGGVPCCFVQTDLAQEA